MTTILAIGLLMFPIATQSIVSSTPEITSEFVVAPDSAPFRSSHASTIVELKDGDLMAAWFAGTAEGKPDVAIWASQQKRGIWSPPVELVREHEVPCWNPVLFHTHDGRLWLYYKFGPSPETWTAGRTFSIDEGKSWSKVEHLPAGLLGPIRAKPLMLDNDVIVSGSSVESYGSWAAWIERSSDGGATWNKIGPIVFQQTLQHTDHPSDDPKNAELPDRLVPRGIIQPSVVALGEKHLRLFARSTSDIAHICIADSYDLGFTWTQARPIDLPNPNSGIDAITLRDGRVVLIFNNTTHGRTPLNLAVAVDGEHFEMFRTLEDQPGEFSYPAIIQTAHGDLEMTYTWNRKVIRHVHLPLSAVPNPTLIAPEKK
jgi:predicted neuraminidase